MRRLLVLAVVALVAGAVPAWAHEEISPYSVPTGRPAYLVLSVANEKRVDLNKVTVTAPTGGLFGHATRDPAGWTSTLSHTVVTWTGGAVKPSRFEQFGFDIEQFGQPGTFVYKVNLAYTDGSSSDVDVPVVAVTGTGAPGVGTPSASGSGTTAAADHPHDEEEGAGTASGSDKGESRANLALGLSLLAVLAAVGAFFAGRRTGAAPPPSTSASTSGTRPPAGQDW